MSFRNPTFSKAFSQTVQGHILKLRVRTAAWGARWRIQRWITAIAGIVAVLLWPVAPAFGGAQGPAATVWQIGDFDQSSHEFNHRAPIWKQTYNPVFTVGKSTVKDWPSNQPGSENENAGLRPHPYTILFNLASHPKGTYQLTISVLLYHPRIPRIQVSLNGQKGLFYFHPELNYYPGDPAFWAPNYAMSTVVMTLPLRDLHTGQNTLVLTALDNAQDGPGDSGLAYDALRLTNDPAQKPSSKPTMSARPSIYYVQNNGGLEEMTGVTVTLPAKVRQGSVRLTVGGQSYTAKLSSSPGFGEQRFKFAVPEWTGVERAILAVRVNGKTYHQTVSLLAKRRWSLYLVPHEHLDVGFTDYRGKVAEVHDHNIDGLLTDLAVHPQMRWSIDGSWIAQQYLASRKPAAQQEFLHLVQEGKIGVPAEYANLLTGYASLEELIRSVFYAYGLHRKADIPFDYANITDVPSYTWSYPSILHALGIHYLAAASNNDRAPILLWGKWNTLSPFWWAGPDGSKVLMSYSRQYSQLAFLCQLPPQMAACAESLPEFLQSYETPSYKPDAALIYGSQVENTAMIPGTTAFVKEWNAQYAYPKLILSTFPDYFKYIDSRFGADLPTVT
ncbi:MAG: polysaccharide lyase family protein, partial [Terriglobia bacterium]